MSNIIQPTTSISQTTKDISQITQTGKITLPPLTYKQEDIYNKLSDPVQQAEYLIRILSLNKISHIPDPITEKIKDDISRENDIEELYLDLISRCEESYFPIFNRLTTFDLMEFLHPTHNPLF